MRCFVGIDLGSTTTKAVMMDDDGAVLGRGITNSRSNYDTASRVAKLEAHISARLTLVRRALAPVVEQLPQCDELERRLRKTFDARGEIRENATPRLAELRSLAYRRAVAERLDDTEAANIQVAKQRLRALSAT